MKKNISIALLPLLAVTLLSACTPSSEPSNEPSSEPSSETAPSLTDEEIVQTALDSLKSRSHSIELHETFSINYPGQKYYVGLYQNHNHKIEHFYSGESRAYRYESKSIFADIDTQTNEIVESTIRQSNTPSTYYEKNLVDGTAEILSVTLQNTLKAETYQFYNVDLDEWQPIYFDNEFINPFDSFTTDDLTLNDDGTLTINDIEKVNYLLTSYSAVSEFYEGDVVTLTLNDNYHVSTINFEFAEITRGVSVINSEVEIDVTVYEVDTYPSIRPFTNNNPALAEALNKYKDLRNFTYVKNVKINGEQKLHLEAYYSEDLILFHHGNRNDSGLYEGNDDYDLKCVYNTKTGVYDVYQWLMMTNEYGWTQAMATEERPYTLETFNDIGPAHHLLSAGVFKDIGDNKYQAEDLIVSTIGQYFDYEVWGVDSFFLETKTTDCVVTLTDNNEIQEVEVTGILDGKTYTFTFYYENVGTTTIPEWING